MYFITVAVVLFGVERESVCVILLSMVRCVCVCVCLCVLCGSVEGR